MLMAASPILRQILRPGALGEGVQAAAEQQQPSQGVRVLKVCWMF